MSAAAARVRLSARWGELAWAGGPDGSGVEVVCAPPTPHRAWWSYATVGLSDGLLRLELVTYAEAQETWPAKLLLDLAGCAAAAALEPYLAIQLDEPLGWEASRLDSVVLLPPYFEAEELGRPDEDGTVFAWVAPVTRAEAELAILAGGRALEDLLFEANLRPVPDPGRASLV
ncbi:MAG: suppressor of fused domain protein [Armatimonadetes bacterium]|nr:suppressor of fused domain protein [Armatimonadota bacterium]